MPSKKINNEYTKDTNIVKITKNRKSIKASELTPSQQKKRDKKLSKTERQKLIFEIFELLVQGYKKYKIIEQFSIKYNKTKKTIENYITHEYELIEEETKKEINDLRMEANARYDELFFRLVQEGKYREAGYVQSLKDRINGLQQQTIDVKNSYTEDLKTFLSNILQKNDLEEEKKK
ncbi:MAG: hypothetical protein GYA62_08490 [Bacteroidales bacterium]|nr:hypothetical protein [Bacteroidales bacterium]